MMAKRPAARFQTVERAGRRALESLRNQPTSARPLPVQLPFSCGFRPRRSQRRADLESIMLPGVEPRLAESSQVEFQDAAGRGRGRVAVGRCRSWRHG